MTLFDAIWDEIHNPHGGRLAAAHARATTAGATFVVGPGETWRVDYTVAPTITRIVKP